MYMLIICGTMEYKKHWFGQMASTAGIGILFIDWYFSDIDGENLVQCTQD